MAPSILITKQPAIMYIRSARYHHQSVKFALSDDNDKGVCRNTQVDL